MSEAKYSYKYRWYYFDPNAGKRGKLIEFCKGSNEDGFEYIVAKYLDKLNAQIGESKDYWMVSAISIEMKTDLGIVNFSFEDFGYVFLSGDNNILDEIDIILAKHPDWKKIEVFERDYHLKKGI